MPVFDISEYFDFFDDDEVESEFSELEKELREINNNSTFEKKFHNHDLCSECLGRGVYIGFRVVEACSGCNKSGWVGKGTGISFTEALRRGLVPWQQK